MTTPATNAAAMVTGNGISGTPPFDPVVEVWTALDWEVVAERLVVVTEAEVTVEPEEEAEEVVVGGWEVVERDVVVEAVEVDEAVALAEVEAVDVDVVVVTPDVVDAVSSLLSGPSPAGPQAETARQ